MLFNRQKKKCYIFDCLIKMQICVFCFVDQLWRLTISDLGEFDVNSNNSTTIPSKGSLGDSQWFGIEFPANGAHREMMFLKIKVQ